MYGVSVLSSAEYNAVSVILSAYNIDISYYFVPLSGVDYYQCINTLGYAELLEEYNLPGLSYGTYASSPQGYGTISFP